MMQERELRQGDGAQLMSKGTGLDWSVGSLHRNRRRAAGQT